MKQGYGFVEFEDSRDADDAINDLDGKSICGRRVQIELAKGDRNARREGDRYGKSTDLTIFLLLSIRKGGILRVTRR